MTGTDPIKAGLVGAGFIGPVHIEAMRRNHVQAVGLVENTTEPCGPKCRALGLEKSYPSLEAMLADPEIQVVHLATPNYLHFPHARAALLAGKHVVCEKPLAMNTQESAELVKLAAETGLVNAVHFNIRFYPLIHQARAMVQEQQELGDLYIIRGSYLQDWLLLPTDWNWRLEPELGGSLRTVGDIGSHWLDLITFITGLQVQKVFADFQIFHPVRQKPARPVETFTGKLLTPADYTAQPIHTEDYASILLHFENGTRGALTVSQMCAGRKNRLAFEINGAKASLAWNQERPNELWIGRREAPNQVLLKDPALMTPATRALAGYPGGHTEGYPDTFKQLSKKVYDYIRRGDFSAKPDFPTFADGHYQLILGEAIARSAAEGRWVEIQR